MGRGREASTRLVQNALFLLGGLLLGVAAIVFTAVAWAQFGVGGRAALLAGFTAAALTAPLAALRRDLRATAETFAAVGLLLVLLDGYAAWHVDLFGVAGFSAPGYAGAVCAVTAAVAAGYEHVTGLAGPRYVALVVAQPVFPLVVQPMHPDAAGWAFVFAAVAVLNLLVIHMRRNPSTGVGITAYVWGLLWVMGAGLGALTALAVASDAAEAATGGAALVAAAGVLVAAGVLARAAVAQAVAGGLLVVALGVAGARLLDFTAGEYASVAIAALVAVLALAVAAVRPLLPAAVRPGPWAGAVAVAVLPVVVVLLGVAYAAGSAVTAARPFLRAAADRAVEESGWQLPAAVGLIAVAVVALLPRAQRRHGTIGGVAALGLTVPAGFGLAWWSAPAVDLLIAAAVVALAVRTAGPGAWPRVLWCGAVAAVLVGHAVLTGFGRATVAALALGAVALIGAAAAVLARPERRSDAGAVALGVGVLAVPASVWAATVAFGVPGTGRTRITLAVAAALAAAVWAVPRTYRAAVHVAALLGLLSAPLWALGSGDSAAIYAAVALLLVVSTVPVGVRASAPVGVVLGLVLAAAVAESVLAVVLVPFEWLGAVWSGRPEGVGLDVAGLVPVVLGDAVAVLLVAVVALVLRVVGRWPATNGSTPSAAGRPVVASRLIHGVTAAVPALIVGVPMVLAASGAAWPVVPAVSLAGGLVVLVAVALRGPVSGGDAVALGAPVSGGDAVALRGPVSGGDAVALGAPVSRGDAVALRGSMSHGDAVACAVVAALLAGAGMAGALPTHGSTLVALGAVLVAGAVAGTAARAAGARVAGWAGAAVAGLGLAYTAGRAAGLDLVPTAFTVLGAAAAVLALGTLLATRPSTVGGSVTADRPVPAGGPSSAGQPASAGPAVWPGRGLEGRVVQAIGHAGAVVALLLTIGEPRYTALVCTLWGLALGLRAIVAGERVAARHGYVVAAAAAELVGWWILVADAEVALREAYTLPAAAVALLAGWLALRRLPELTSWVTYGPALAAAMLPTLAGVLVDDGQPVRRLALGLGALAVVVAGAYARLQAPVVIGGAVLALVAVHEIVLVWDLLPRWIPLALAGLLLVGLAMTLERRRRDLARVRAAITRMT